MQSQLTLFSYFNESFERGLDLLSQLNFIEAEKVWAEVLEQDKTGSDAQRAIELILYWRGIKEQCLQLAFTDVASFLHRHLENYQFTNTSPDKVLNKALKIFRLDMMIRAGIFELEPGIDIVDVSIGLNKEDIVLSFLEKLLESEPNSAMIRARLADILWEKAEFTTAKKNYALALLCNHNEINVEKIRHKNLKKIIEKNGTEMACTYAWLHGELSFPENATAINNKCLKACQLVMKENQLTLETNRSEVLMLRSQLKQLDEEFFVFFMQRKRFFEPKRTKKK